MGIMIRRRKLRSLVGILKDKASLVKATLSTNRHASSLRVAVLRATTHDMSSPPSENRISAVLGCGGQGTRRTSCACVDALMGRLHATCSAAVALKCLLVAHNIVSRGSFILKDQLSFYPSSGGQNFLNLSTFRDKSDNDTWQLSSWVRWYATVVEQNLIVSRALGYYLSNSSSTSSDHNNKVLALLSSELLCEVDALVGYVECTREAPDPSRDHVEMRRNGLVYEVLGLVGKDYRLVQHEVSLRFKELGDRIKGLSSGELTRFLDGLKRLEGCKERLLSLFLKRRSDDKFWDTISEVKTKILEVVEKRGQKKRLVTWVGGEDHVERKSTRFWIKPPWTERPPGTVVPVSICSGGW
ncbi:AP180 N-terminal domain containing protein [Parasponia andersonii]|uniref:AP180 N-terminal domain containing protein n=1 Tax=Parasponia andersonii TaxID=3476 RepID=A0A2P5BDK4_PARAD|nr:AP180 N-terminal domain containing protein [Parasponia andersonii]